MLRQMILIAGKDLKLRLRDRSVFIVGLLAPALLALIFTFAFGDALDPDGGGFTASFGLVDLDAGAAGAELGLALDQISKSDQFSVETYATRAAGESALSDGDIAAMFIVPAGFSDAVESGGAELEVVGDIDAPTSTGIADAIARGYAVEVDRVSLTVASELAWGVDPAEIPSLVEDASTQQPLARIGPVTAAVRQMDGATAAMAGMAVFFLFFTVQFGVASLLEERQFGTWARLMSSTSKGVVIGAKALVSFVLGVVSMAVLMAGASLGLGADWGDPVAVSALVIVGVLAATAVMSVVAAFSKTVEGAGNVQGIIAVVLGMLGGSFFPVGTDGGLLSRLSLLTPHAWFLRGLNDLAGGGSVGLVMPSLLAIGGFAVILGSIAVVAFSRKAML